MDDSATLPVKVLNLPHSRLRRYAQKLLDLYHSKSKEPLPEHPISVVCISDTHNTQPFLPPGDILLHAGDLSENGTYDELQTQLKWLNQQPHKHKVFIAGNHDILLDQAFLDANPRRKETMGDKKAADLDFGSLIYLRDESVTLDFESPGSSRQLKIYGSPSTPQYVPSGFQVPRDQDPWTNVVPNDTDILLTHGPPWMHLDGALRSGCVYLAREIARCRPSLVVFGHIHVSYGTEDVTFHGVKRGFEKINQSVGGWFTLFWMAVQLVWTLMVTLIVPGRWRKPERITKLVNAAVVGGESHQYRNEPIIVAL